MADDTKKAEELAEKIEKTTPRTTAPGAAPAVPVVVGARHKPEPKRLSKGMRKHIRRQKEAGEFKVPPHR